MCGFARTHTFLLDPRWYTLMKNIWSIYLKDLRSVGTNWVSAIIISGLIILPSLYAWLNIAASWDPYGRTSQIPVGIVNQDTGATVQGHSFNAGKELISELKDNHDMNWKFSNQKEALKHLNNGDYFAVIVIPQNFSAHLATVINTHPEKATLEYYVNEKINSIAPKITSKGASVLVETMSSKFIGTVNGTIFDIFNRIGVELQRDIPDIEKFKDFVFTLEKDLPTIYDKLKIAQQDVVKASEILQYAKEKAPQVNNLTSKGLSTVDQTLTFVDHAESQLNSISPQVKQDIETVKQISTTTNNLLTRLSKSNLTFSDATAIKTQLNKNVSEANEKITTINQLLLSLKQYITDHNIDSNSQQLDNAIAQTEAIQTILQQAQTQGTELNTLLDNKEQEISNSLGQLQQIASNTSIGLDRFTNIFEQTIEPTILSQITNVKQTLTQAKTILLDIKKAIPEVENILNNANSFVNDTKKGMNTLISEYPIIYDRVHQLANKIRNFDKEMNLESIIQLLINDPLAEKSFFEEPIKMHENRIFPIPNYGTGMAPFYSVLAIWVGCLLLISLLAVDTNEDAQYKIREVYFGKLLTFWTIGLLQTAIIVLGDIFILHVSAQSPVCFFFFSLFISLVFMSIVYTLVSVFGDVGKALSIILLVLQLAGSGGTYPTVLLPKFFQIINPYLPFTYAISLTREAIGGITQHTIIIDFIFLSILLIFCLIFGSIFKKQLRDLTRKMLRKSRESGLFH